MNLPESIAALQLALDEVIRATLSDDKTPLGNSLALSKIASSIGTGGDNPDVVVFGDLNRFHDFNGQHGHDAGDAAITYVGKLIKKSFVDECQAKAYRRSGDEFVILLSSHSIETFKTKASAFAACSFSIEKQRLETAMSFGYALSEGEISFADLLARAETACQAAKSRGDGVCIEWSEEIERQAMGCLRARCSNCEASITCYVPQRAIPESRSMLSCPCCGQSLQTPAMEN
jgi:diguanylate cyclase (GGDEF)-like protein